MPTQEKVQQVDELKELLDKATCLISTNYSQMTGNMAVQLRNALREQEIKFVVIKNRLAYIAADEIGKPEFKEIAKGPTGIVVSFGDPVTAAKAINNFITSETASISITGGLLDGKILSPEESASFAKILYFSTNFSGLCCAFKLFLTLPFENELEPNLTVSPPLTLGLCILPFERYLNLLLFLRLRICFMKYPIYILGFSDLTH